MKIKTHPTRICGFGEKLYFDDDKQYPDTHYVTFEYPGDDTFGSNGLSCTNSGLVALLGKRGLRGRLHLLWR